MAISLLIDNTNLVKTGSITESTCLTEAEINELVEARLIKADFMKVRDRLMALDDCWDNPCLNGECIDLENDYRCNCYPGKWGKNCDLNCPGLIVDRTCFR